MGAHTDRPGEDRVVIVTGGSRGLGRAAVVRLAQLGYAVVVNYLGDQRTAEATVDLVLEGRGAAVAVRADIADELDVERLFAQAVQTFGQVDGVVHAVRGQVTAASVAAATVAEFEAVCRTNVRGAFIVNRAAAHQVRRGGAVINLFRAVGPASKAYGAYALSTAAIEQLTRALAVEVQERDVTVNAVSVDIEAQGAPETVADVVAYLLSDGGHAVTGQVIHLRPGRSQ